MPQDAFTKCDNFKVHTMTDLCDQLKLAPLIGDRCRLPDHSIICADINIPISCVNHDYDIMCGDMQQSLGNDIQDPTAEVNRVNRKHYKFDQVPNEFMSSDRWKSDINELIDLFATCQKEQREMDNVYDSFCCKVTEEMDKYLKYSESSKQTRKRYKNHKPYWNERLNELWKDMRDSEVVYIQCRGSRHRKSYLRNQFVYKRQIFDKALRGAERSYNTNKLLDIENCCVENPRDFWNHISKLGPRKDKQIPMKVYDENNVLNDNIEIVLNKWRNDFMGLYNKPGDLSEHDNFYTNICNRKITMENEMENDEYDSNFELNRALSYDEVEKIIFKLKSKKATGLDSIPNEVLKHKDVMMLLYKLYVKCFEYCILPSVWLKSIVVPVPKSSTKDPFVPLNYRGISLLSCICKVFSGIINKRVIDYCELMNLIVDEQNGFRKDRSCTDHIFALSSLVKNRLAQNRDTYACFIDMQKAFDWVDRDLLFYRLLEYNIDGNIYKCIKALYNHPTCCVQLNGYHTEWFPTESGVRQGDSLSPTLFALYINNLAETLKQLNIGINFEQEKVCILLFADDIVILGESEQDLQNLLNCVYEWCTNWKLKINMEKSKIIHFRNKRRRETEFNFYIGRDVVEKVDKYKYLGIYLNEYMDFNETAGCLAGAGGRALGGIISKFRSFKNVGFNTYSSLYHSGVVPVMDYSSGIWGYNDFDCCNKVQQRALRYYLGVHQKTPLLAIEGDTGWIPSQIRRQKEMLRYWNRLLNMDSSRLTHKIFLYDYNMCHKNWCSDLKMLFSKIDDVDTFNNKHVCDIDKLTRQNLNLYSVDWQQSLASKPKLRTYMLFKDTFETEDYVRHCFSQYNRSLLAQLRCGVLPLQIEIGRFRNKKVEERICQTCEKNIVEDEFHFICVCESYNCYREHLYSDITVKNAMFVTYSDDEKFVYMLKNEWKLLSMYMQKAWNRRNGLMYI